MTAPKYKTVDRTTGEDLEKDAIQQSSGATDSGKIIATNDNGLIDSSLLKESRQLIHTVEINGNKDVHHGQLVKYDSLSGSHTPALLSNGDKQRVFTNGASPDLIHNTVKLTPTANIHTTSLGFIPLESDYSIAFDFASDDVTDGATIVSSYDTNGYGWRVYLANDGKPVVTGNTDVTMGTNVATSALVDGVWQKMVFNYTAATRLVELIINGVVVISFNITGALLDPTSSNLFINGYDLQQGDGVQGGGSFNICMLSVWYKTLSGADITEHVNGDKGLDYDDYSLSLQSSLQSVWPLHNGVIVNQYFTDLKSPNTPITIVNISTINAGEFPQGDELIGIYTGTSTVTHGNGQQLDAVSEGFAKIALPDFPNMSVGDPLTFDNQGYLRLRVPGEDRPIIGVFHGPADPQVATINWVRIVKPTYPDVKMYEIPVPGAINTEMDSILATRRIAGGDYVWFGKSANLIRVWAKLGTSSGSITRLDTTTTRSRLNTGDSTIFTEFLIPSETNDEYGAPQETINNVNGNDGRLEHGDKIFFEVLANSAFTGKDLCLKFEIEDVRF